MLCVLPAGRCNGPRSPAAPSQRPQPASADVLLPSSIPNPHSDNNPAGQGGAARPRQRSCSHLGSLLHAVFPPLPHATWRRAEERGQTPTLAVPRAAGAGPERAGPAPSGRPCHKNPFAQHARGQNCKSPGPGFNRRCGKRPNQAGLPRANPKAGRCPGRELRGQRD